MCCNRFATWQSDLHWLVSKHSGSGCSGSISINGLNLKVEIDLCLKRETEEVDRSWTWWATCVATEKRSVCGSTKKRDCLQRHNRTVGHDQIIEDLVQDSIRIQYREEGLEVASVSSVLIKGAESDLRWAALRSQCRRLGLDSVMKKKDPGLSTTPEKEVGCGCIRFC